MIGFDIRISNYCIIKAAIYHGFVAKFLEILKIMHDITNQTSYNHPRTWMALYLRFEYCLEIFQKMNKFQWQFV